MIFFFIFLFFFFSVFSPKLHVVITIYQSYFAILIAFFGIGLCKGLKTVFMALVIPSYVPLHRLPGASGLQLIFAGIFYFFVGPVVGTFYFRLDFHSSFN